MIEKISRAILYLLIVGPMTFAAFMVGPPCGIAFASVMILGAFRRSKYDNT